MVTITQTNESQFNVSDGRSIIKDTNDWYVMSKEGNAEYGPVSSFESAKQYIEDPESDMQPHSDKRPAMLWAVVMLIVCMLLLLLRNL